MIDIGPILHWDHFPGVRDCYAVMEWCFEQRGIVLPPPEDIPAVFKEIDEPSQVLDVIWIPDKEDGPGHVATVYDARGPRVVSSYPGANVRTSDTRRLMSTKGVVCYRYKG